MNSSQTIGRSHSRKHYHQQSMDDFMKNIKKYNLRSQRYISPKPLLYMYAKNNTTNTIEKSRSRTLSNHKSPHSKSKRSKKDRKSSSKQVKDKLQKIFKIAQQAPAKKQPQNPAVFIQKCGQKLKKAEKYLQGKNTIGLYLCEQFLIILNQIVQKMVNQLDKQLKQIQTKTIKQIQRKFKTKIQKLERKKQKMDKIIQQLLYKAQNNSKLIYEVRKMSQIDIDHIFGKTVLGTDKCGGRGYGNHNGESYQQSSNFQQDDQNIIATYPNQPNKIVSALQRNKQQEQRYLLRKKAEKGFKQLKFQFRQFHNEFNQLAIKKQQNQETQKKQSGRIRQAYDWEREAHDDSQRMRRKREPQQKLITELQQQQQQFNIRAHRKST